MRFARLSSFASTTVLAAATVLSGAGVAQANSLGSLIPGSSTAGGLMLTIDKVAPTATSGTFTNNTLKTQTYCTGVLSTVENVRILEAGLKDGVDLYNPPASVVEMNDAAREKGQLWTLHFLDDIAPGQTVTWDGVNRGPATTEAFRAGAVVVCQKSDTDATGRQVTSVYQDASSGSLDLGSLTAGNLFGSSN